MCARCVADCEVVCTPSPWQEPHPSVGPAIAFTGQAESSRLCSVFPCPVVWQLFVQFHVPDAYVICEFMSIELFPWLLPPPHKSVAYGASAQTWQMLHRVVLPAPAWLPITSAPPVPSQSYSCSTDPSAAACAPFPNVQSAVTNPPWQFAHSVPSLFAALVLHSRAQLPPSPLLAVGPWQLPVGPHVGVAASV